MPTKSHHIPALLIPLIVIAFSLRIDAQHFKVSTGAGYSLPMGQLASHDFATGGYALLGFHSAFEGSWFFNHNFGATVNISGNSYAFATGWYMLDYIAQDPFMSHLEMRSTPYYVRSFMAGGSYRKKLWKKISGEGKITGGIVSAKTPDQFYGGTYYVVGNLYWSKTPSRSIIPGIMGGINLSYQLFEHTHLQLASEFIYARAKFKFIRGNQEYTKNMALPLFHLRPSIMLTF